MNWKVFFRFVSVLTVRSITGTTVRLTDERWLHIVEGHPETAGRLNDVLLTIAAPDIVLQGNFGELLAVTFNDNDKSLVVIYKEDGKDGFILTSYLTSKVEKILKKPVVWQKC